MASLFRLADRATLRTCLHLDGSAQSRRAVEAAERAGLSSRAQAVDEGASLLSDPHDRMREVAA